MSRFNYIPIPIPSEDRARRFWAKVAIGAAGDCWPIAKAVTAGNYCRFGKVLAHRFAYVAAKGTIPDGMDVLHSCDNPVCCNPSHLRVGSHRENMADMAGRGRVAARRGEEAGAAKLTTDEVVEIRRLYAGGERQRRLAAMFGVSQLNISRIVRGVTWVEAGGPISPRCQRSRPASARPLAARGAASTDAPAAVAPWQAPWGPRVAPGVPVPYLQAMSEEVTR